MDRNLYYQDNKNRPAAVALRKESVDRNIKLDVSYSIIVQSLSARRAWIEMDLVYSDGVVSGSSLSARRAWIEMSF